jgi:hypothetical protein
MRRTRRDRLASSLGIELGNALFGPKNAADLRDNNPCYRAEYPLFFARRAMALESLRGRNERTFQGLVQILAGQ